MNAQSVLKLGTRKSLLAQTQSQWVAQRIEEKNPGLRVELVGIETRGDKILDIPLSQTEGKEFFVAELDQALRSGQVDLNVHSLKDLSLDRPSEFSLVIPPRKDPRDVIIFHESVLHRIAEGLPIRLGTSAPRRLENIPPFLQKALPVVNHRSAKLECVEIRGNVNTRLSRLHEPEGHPKKLDAVVLALAGLIRLHENLEARIELQGLLQNTRWMILPIPDCPSAPGQGALAVECRTQDSLALSAIQKIHHPESLRQVEAEREVLAHWGGGCHQRFGVTSIAHPTLGQCRFSKGKKSNGEHLDEIQRTLPILNKNSNIRPWNGAKIKSLSESCLDSLRIPVSTKSVFVAHSRAVLDQTPRPDLRIWTSGTASWFELAKKGWWVEGCAESMGFFWITHLLQEKFLNLPPLSEWMIWTHEGSEEGWLEIGVNQENILTSYRHLESSLSDEDLSNLQKATHVYWSSPAQANRYLKNCSREAIHACGPGKTSQFLEKSGIPHFVFIHSEEWNQWISH